MYNKVSLIPNIKYTLYEILMEKKQKRNETLEKATLGELLAETYVVGVNLVETDLKVKATAELQKEIEAELEVADPEENQD